MNLQFKWLAEGGNTFWFQVPRLPGPNRYHVAWRWDSATGLFDGFINGTPMRAPGAMVAAWQTPGGLVPITVGDTVDGLEIASGIWTGEDIRGKLAAHDHIDMDPLSGFGDKLPLEDLKSIRGELLYAPDLSDESTFADWKMEGPGAIGTDDDGWLTMWSTN